MAFQLTPEMLAGPAMTPPLGEIPNFINPWSCGDVLIGVGGALCGLMIIFVGLRMLLKIFVSRRLTWDDATCVIGMLLTLVYYGMSVVAVHSAKYGTHFWNVTLATSISDTTNTIEFIAITVAPLTLGFIKVTFFILFFQLFRPDRSLKIAILIGMVFTVIFYLLTFILGFISVAPRPGETWLSHVEFNPIEKIEIDAAVWIPTVGIVIDLYILILPLCAVSTLHLARKRKIQVGSVFATGVLAVVASILSLVFRVKVYQNPLDDLTYNQVFVLLTSMIEMTLGVIIACLPAFSKIMQHVIQPGFTSIRSRITASRGTGSRSSGGRSAGVAESTDSASWSKDRKAYPTGIHYLRSNSSESHLMQSVVSMPDKNDSLYTGPASNSVMAVATRPSQERKLGVADKSQGNIYMQYDIQVESQKRENGHPV